MKLTVLGSGTSVPHPERSSSCYWMETASGTLLLDLPASAIHRMPQERLDWADLDAIWISHFHLDHCGGLAPFLFGTKYAPQTQTRSKPLRIYGPKGLTSLLESFNNANNYRLFDQPFPLDIIEVEPMDGFDILDGISAVTFDTPHTPESCAIRIENQQGASMVFTSDTGPSKPLGSFAKNTDLLLMECSFVRDKPVEHHIQLEEAVFLARYSKARLTVLTHLYPEWDNVDLAEELEEIRPGCEIVAAADGQTYLVGK